VLALCKLSIRKKLLVKEVLIFWHNTDKGVVRRLAIYIVRLATLNYQKMK